MDKTGRPNSRGARKGQLYFSHRSLEWAELRSWSARAPQFRYITRVTSISKCYLKLSKKQSLSSSGFPIFLVFTINSKKSKFDDYLF